MESLRGVNVSNSALEVLATLNTTLSGEDQTLDRLWGGTKCTYKVSQSTGTVKASAGVLYGWIGAPAGAGTFAIKDGATELGVFTVSAGVVVNLPGITFATSISISASSAIATIFYL